MLKKKLMRHQVSLNQVMHHVLSKIEEREITPCGRAHPNPALTTPPVNSSARQTVLLLKTHFTT